MIEVDFDRTPNKITSDHFPESAGFSKLNLVMPEITGRKIDFLMK
ncbi:hypothetical protein SAMN00777080_4203 [Aquiflexum balticum DSM 16537]|uniref:Uncharacterized protein n=1 Tax=Aquiflexum balticum DSM 16537 TaxID=758820 RepID=A0A1W2HA26_9BACT|nr:hypothetical protein SAMN00777080_4203 [Aquiflexum balticum DSM 16537]